MGRVNKITPTNKLMTLFIFNVNIHYKINN